MDKDRFAGSAKDLAGKVEGTVGDIAGDVKTQISIGMTTLCGAAP